MIHSSKLNKKVAGYGAAAKGNTLLNYCGVKKDLLPCVVDASISKQGKFLPGSHIPIFSINELIKFKPDYVLILPWNIFDEIKSTLNTVLHKSTKYVRAIPTINIS